jgi:citronellol/citronellal dehydrogenase
MGRIDALINNAGVAVFKPIGATSFEEWRHVLSTNLDGAFLCSQACVPVMLKTGGGSIVNIVADIWGSMPGMGHSGAARAGMVSFTETAAVEWAGQGVRVNAVAPGYIASSGMDHYPPEAGPMLRAMAQTVPLGRFGTEAETAAGIVFLLSPAAAFISGSTLRIDGARPQVRMGWPMTVASAKVQARASIAPFDGFHRATTPQVFAKASGFPVISLSAPSTFPTVRPIKPVRF